MYPFLFVELRSFDSAASDEIRNRAEPRNTAIPRRAVNTREEDALKIPNPAKMKITPALRNFNVSVRMNFK